MKKGRGVFFAILVWFVPCFGSVATTNTPGEYFSTTQNALARSIGITVTVGASGVNVVIAPQTASAAVITGVPGVADISVKPQSITQTYAQIQQNKGISVPITLTATANSSATPPGYQVIMSLLFSLINLDLTNVQFFQLQMPPVTPGVAGVLYCNILYNGQPTDKWILGPPQGLSMSQTWKTDDILQMATNQSSSVTFTFFIPTTSFVNLLQGKYWMNLFAIMSTPSTDTALVPNQIATLAKFIDQGNGMLQNQNSVYVLTDAQIAVIKTNQAFLVKTIAAIKAANTP